MLYLSIFHSIENIYTELKHTEQGPSVEEIKVEEATDTRKKHKAPSSSSVSQDSVKKAKSEPIQQTFEPVPDPGTIIILTSTCTLLTVKQEVILHAILQTSVFLLEIDFKSNLLV